MLLYLLDVLPCRKAIHEYEHVFVKSYSGMDSKDALIRKCAGVKASGSFGSADIGVSGLEFRIASISITKVLNSSKVKRASLTVRLI